MDDDDIEWELSKMDEAERRREAPLLRTVYRPVDPGLKARILRMFGQPYDKSAIPRGQEFYLNGWDNGEDDGEDGGPLVKLPDFTARQGGRTRPAFGYDPWAGAWRPDWGPEGNPLRTMEERRRDGMVLPSRGDVIRPLSFAASGHDAGVHMKAGAAANPHAGGYADGGAYGDMTLPEGTPTTGSNQDASSDRGLKGYLHKLGMRESSNNYKARNSETGYIGKYQMGDAALADAGFYYDYLIDGAPKVNFSNKFTGTWTDKAKAYGVNSYGGFLNNPESQEAAIRASIKKNWEYIRNNGYDKYIGKEIHGIKVTASGLLAACHLVGIGGLGELLEGKSIPADGNKTKATEYLEKKAGFDLTEILGYNPDKE